MIHDRLKCNAVPIQLPIGAEETFKGIIDLVEMKADIYYDELGKDMRVEEIPADMMELAQEYRDQAARRRAPTWTTRSWRWSWKSEDIPAGHDPKAAIRKGTIDNKIVPVTCGTSYRNKGVQKLLDAIVDYMPSPLDIPRHQGRQPRDGGGGRPPCGRRSAVLRPGLQDCHRSLCGQAVLLPRVLRHAEHRHVGAQLHQGPARSASAASCRCTPTTGRISRRSTPAISPPSVGLKNTTTGDTLCDEKHPIILESMEFPEPVIRVAIEPKTKAGQEKMGIALAKLAEEDPTFKHLHRRGDRPDHHRRHGRAPSGDHRGPSAARVQGGGQRRRAPGRLQGDHPQERATQDTKYARQSGGKGQYGHVKITRGAQRVRQGL